MNTSHRTLAEALWFIASGGALLAMLSAEVSFVVWLWQATGTS